MSWPLIVNPIAEDDIAEAKDWYDRQRDGLGGEFIECVGEVMERLRAAPEVHAKVYQELRRLLVRRFPYAVFDRIDDDQVTVVAVYHCRRDPRGWQRRAGQ